MVCTHRILLSYSWTSKLSNYLIWFLWNILTYMKYLTTPSDMSKYILCYRCPFDVVISPHNKIETSAGFVCLSYWEGFQKITAWPFSSFFAGGQKKCWTCQFWEWQWRLRDSDSSAMFKRHFTYHTTWP